MRKNTPIQKFTNIKNQALEDTQTTKKSDPYTVIRDSLKIGQVQERVSEQTSVRRGACMRSEQYGASKRVSGAGEQANV